MKTMARATFPSRAGGSAPTSIAGPDDVRKALEHSAGRVRLDPPSGDALDETEQPLGFIEDFKAATYATRHQTAPIAVMGLLWMGASAAHHAGRPGMVAVTAPVIAVVLWWAWLRKRTRKERRVEVRRIFARVAVACALWAMWAAAVGAFGLPSLALALIGPLVARSYWQRHRLSTLPEPVEQPPAIEPLVVVEPERHPVEVRWEQRVAANPALAGSWLDDFEQIRGGARWTAHLVPGQQDFSTVFQHRRKIASALEMTLEDVVVEPHASRLESLATLLVLTDNPLKKNVPWTGPTYDPATGKITIGMYADGEPAYYRVNDLGSGLHGGAVIAGKGIGKSRLLEGIGASLLHSGLFVLWHGDGKGGSSLPTLARHADWTALDPAEITRMLQAAVRGMAYRAKWQALHGLSYFDPTPERPGLYIVLDEVHKFLINQSTPATQALTTITREGRSLGVQALCADQAPQLPNWGGSDELRSNLWISNNIVGRIESKSGPQVIPGLPMPASELPNVKGFFYTVESEEGHGRTSPLRTFKLEDPDAAYEGLPDVHLEPVFTGAAGEDYRDRAERFRRTRDRDIAELEALASGAILLAAPAQDPASGPPVPDSDLPVLAPAVIEGADTSARDRILRAVADGINRNKDLAPAVELSENYVGFLLQSMRRNGLVDKANKQAPWELTPAGQVLLERVEVAS